jgi:hypothetical protein
VRKSCRAAFPDQWQRVSSDAGGGVETVAFVQRPVARRWLSALLLLTLLTLSPGDVLSAAALDGGTRGIASSSTDAADLKAGTSAVVRADGDCLRVRDTPGLGGKLLTRLPEGAVVQVLDGKQSADGYDWQKVQSGSIVGWAASKYLQPAGDASSNAPCPAAPRPQPQTVSSDSAGFTGDVPEQGGYGLVVWEGGTAEDMAATADAGGCQLSAVWATDADGHLLVYIYGALDVVNADWLAEFTDGEVPEGTPVLLVCGRPKSSALQSNALSSAAPALRGGSSSLIPMQLTTSAAPQVGAKAAAVLDGATGELLAGQSPHLALPPASLTKMVTAILAIQEGDLDAWVKTDVDSRTMTDSSLMGLLPGDCFQLRDLIYGLLLPSGNDAAIAIARFIAGSEDAFVQQMNALVASMGLTDTHFVDVHGLDASGHAASAYDLAMIARYGMTYPFFAQVVDTAQRTAKGSRTIKLPNVNGFLSSYQGADGVKTGFTDGAGRTLVASATRNGRQIFVVLLNDQNRYEDAAKLMDWAFAN